MFSYNQRGQILLLMILILAVAMTVGLSIASQTVTNLRTTTEEKNSEEAFSAAEAGLERSLQNNSNLSGSLPSNASYTTTVTTVLGTQFLLNAGSVITKDNPADVWLSTYPGFNNPTTGYVTIYWGASSDACTTSASTNTMPAIEISTIAGTANNPKMSYAVFDPCQVRSTNNHFTYVNSGGGSVSGQSFAYKATLQVNSGLLMRVIPLYASTQIGVTGCDGANNNCAALPSQGTKITSVGTSDTSKREIVRLQQNPQIPAELFSYTLFSP